MSRRNTQGKKILRDDSSKIQNLLNNNQPARNEPGSRYSEHTVDTNGLRNILRAANTPSMKGRRLRKKSNVSLNNDDIDDEDDDGSSN
jgi:hypothetical protein